MPIVRAQVSIPAFSTVSEDTVTNTWHFTATDTEEGTLASMQAALVAMYEGFDTWKSDLHVWQNSRVKWYDLDDEEPRVPVKDAAIAFTSAPIGDSLPHECAAVLSFHGDYVSGASQARRRGRIYFGPLNTSAVTASSGMLASALPTGLATAAGVFLTTSNAASDWAWVVYSPTSNQAFPVVAGWVDNAVDIQRRRGFKASTRTLF
jgi:hypothetical protein